MSWFSSWMHPERGYEKAQEELNKFFQQSQGYLQPYNQQGQSQYDTLQNYINSLKDPSGLLDQWTKGYQESDAAKQAETMAQGHGLNAASSMGLLGSNTALNAIQSGTANIGAQDKQAYLDNLMQKYLAGANLASGIYNTGANTAGQQAQNANQMGQNSANMAYGQQAAGGNMINGLLGLGAGLAGGALGGPLGSALAKRWNVSGGA